MCERAELPWHHAHTHLSRLPLLTHPAHGPALPLLRACYGAALYATRTRAQEAWSNDIFV